MLLKRNCICAYMQRATSFLNRKWTGDIYAAMRDYLYIITHWPDYEKAYLGVMECMVLLKWKEELLTWIDHYKECFPSYQESTVRRFMDFLSSETALRDSPTITETERELRNTSVDYDYRFIGHCNTTTDIKEANFLGNKLFNVHCKVKDLGLHSVRYVYVQ